MTTFESAAVGGIFEGTIALTVRIRLKDWFVRCSVLRLLLHFAAPMSSVDAQELDLNSVGVWPEFVRGNPVDVAVAGNHAYIANGKTGLLIVDVTDPVNLVPVGVCDTPDNAVDVAVLGDHAYVADSDSGLQVIEIRDPTHPVRVGGFDTDGRATGVAVRGDYVYVADRSAGLHVIDISSPANPVLVRSHGVVDSAIDVTVWGHLALVADSAFGLLVFDVHDPHKASLVGTYDTANGAGGVAASGGHAYVGVGSAGLQVIDISAPAKPKLVGTYDTDGSAGAVVVSDNQVYVADRSGGLKVIEADDPAEPRLAGSYDEGGSVKNVAVLDNHVFVATESRGLQVIDVSVAASPVLLGSYETKGRSVDVAASGDHVFVADGSAGLRVIDVGVPSNPILVATHTGIDSGHLAVLDDHGFVLGARTLEVIDFSDPKSVVSVGSLDMSQDSPADLAIAGDRVFIADTEHGLHVVDVRDRGNPTRLGTFDFLLYALSMRVVVSESGDCVFVGYGFGDFNRQTRLLAVDVSDPANPAPMGELKLDSDGHVGSMAVSGSHAYVGGQRRLHVIDIRDPRKMVHVRSCDALAHTVDMVISGKHAYVAGWRRLQALDLSDPSNPVPNVGIDVRDQAFGVALSGNLVFVADADAGLLVVEATPRISITPMPVAPGQRDLRFLLSGPSGANLRLQRSIDLLEWEDWRTITLPNEQAELTDPDLRTEGRRFYRVVSP